MRTNCADHQDDENYQVSPLEGERERERERERNSRSTDSDCTHA